jgi:hypothetical protein
MNNTVELMKEEILTELKRGEGFDSIKDRSNELVDSYLPIYNNEIIKEWKDMPGEYDDRGADELGADNSIGIVGRMSLDLYLYYTDLLNEAIQEVEESVTLCADCDALVTITQEPYGTGVMAAISCPNCGVSYDTNVEVNA